MRRIIHFVTDCGAMTVTLHPKSAIARHNWSTKMKSIVFVVGHDGEQTSICIIIDVDYYLFFLEMFQVK